MSNPSPDRYISFRGIDCDGRASYILRKITSYVAQPPHKSRWIDYFREKLRDRHTIGQDDLHFIGSQINNIQALFEEYQDTEALALLEKLEDECC